jgi:hypothetical protein
VDQYQTVQTVIPPRLAIHIAKATNGSWIQVNNIGGGSGGSLPPQTGHEGEFLTTNGTSASWFSPDLFINSSDFEADGVTYIDTNLVNNKLSIFWNDINRFIYSADEEPSQIEFEYLVGGGFRILIPGFDANTNSYHFFISLRGLNT